MNYKKIELTISKDGTIKERVINGDGKTCTDLTAGLETALGEVESRELLPLSNQEYLSFLNGLAEFLETGNMERSLEIQNKSDLEHE